MPPPSDYSLDPRSRLDVDVDFAGALDAPDLLALGDGVVVANCVANVFDV
jgi:hypothetical protein